MDLDKYSMTVDEAIYCLQSYQPNHEGYNMCLKCRHYGSKENDGILTCKSSEARGMAIEALNEIKKGDLIHGNV